MSRLGAGSPQTLLNCQQWPQPGTQSTATPAPWGRPASTERSQRHPNSTFSPSGCRGGPRATALGEDRRLHSFAREHVPPERHSRIENGESGNSTSQDVPRVMSRRKAYVPGRRTLKTRTATTATRSPLHVLARQSPPALAAVEVWFCGLRRPCGVVGGCSAAFAALFRGHPVKARPGGVFTPLGNFVCDHVRVPQGANKYRRGNSSASIGQL